jgi:SAM-dependent methyltransferase
MDAMLSPSPPQLATDIFNRQRIRLRRAVMEQRGGEAPFLASQIAAQVADRLADIQRTWAKALIIGLHPQLAQDLEACGLEVHIAEPSDYVQQAEIHPAILQCDMDRLFAAKGPFDLIIWPTGLESTNDVPGALAQCRALLRPDGIIIGAVIGAGSLPALRQAMRDAQTLGMDNDAHSAVARFHPHIDVRAMGDLLLRTGFALPTVDVDPFPLRYPNLQRLVQDLRGSALTNMLRDPVHALSRMHYAAVTAAFAAQADTDGRIRESLSLIHFIGWAPHADQPKPARRGSATASLAKALQQPKSL